MKSIIIIGCLIGGIFVFSGDARPATVTYSLTKHASISLSEVPSNADEDRVWPSIPPTTVAEVTYISEPVKAETAQKPSFNLQTLNGITLYDDTKAVTKKLGEPDRITEDPHLKELVIYEYPNMNIVFSDGIVNFVELIEGTKTVLVDGVEIEATIEALKNALGKPDYVTEDGFVFERGEALLKIFLDTDSQQLTSIHYFHVFSM